MDGQPIERLGRLDVDWRSAVATICIVSYVGLYDGIGMHLEIGLKRYLWWTFGNRTASWKLVGRAVASLLLLPSVH